MTMADEFKGTTWTQEDSIDYLTLNPLPADFVWKNRDGKMAEVRPTYSVTNYGKWLHETPYFPGLFELIHDLLFLSGKRLPDIHSLAAQLRKIHLEREGQMKLL